MKALIDGDILLYKCGFIAEYRGWKILKGTDTLHQTRKAKDADEYIDFMCNEGECTRESVRTPLDVQIAKDIFDKKIEDILSATGSTEYMCFYTVGKKNFRFDIAKTRVYKGNRKPDSKPLCYVDLFEYATKNHPYTLCTLEEADDQLGIQQNADTIICTIDKDLDMIPGMHYNFDKEIVYEISSEQGFNNFYTQLIMGDTTDNIPGIPGKGKAAATKALKGINDPMEMFGIAREMYIEASCTPEYFLEQARLLYIRQEEGELWSPPDE